MAEILLVFLLLFFLRTMNCSMVGSVTVFASGDPHRT